MNAGGVSKACKSIADALHQQGKRERNTLVTYLEDKNNPEKFGIILDKSGGTQVIPT